ncbi:unnamed protein product, partial [Boreogadus saida]
VVVSGAAYIWLTAGRAVVCLNPSVVLAYGLLYQGGCLSSWRTVYCNRAVVCLNPSVVLAYGLL